MKSQQQDRFQTECKSCAYLTEDKCRFGRIEKFDKRGEVIWTPEGPVIDRLCNISSKKEVENPRAHIECKFGVVIFDYIDGYSVRNTVDSLKNVNYDKKKFKIVISSCHNEKSYELFNIINELKKEGFKAELIITLCDEADIEKDAFGKCLGASHFCKINAGYTISPDTFNKIDTSLNDDLEKLLFFETPRMKIIDFSAVNNYYLEHGSFDALFTSLKQESEYKYYKYLE
jgi:hypothetical protein